MQIESSQNVPTMRSIGGSVESMEGSLVGIVRVNLDLISSQRWLGLAHGLGTWFVVAHGIVPWYCMC